MRSDVNRSQHRWQGNKMSWKELTVGFGISSDPSILLLSPDLGFQSGEDLLELFILFSEAHGGTNVCLKVQVESVRLRRSLLEVSFQS